MSECKAFFFSMNLRIPINPIIFQLLLSGDEKLQVTSVKCIAAILVHSPSQYSVFFTKADVPGNT